MNYDHSTGKIVTASTLAAPTPRAFNLPVLYTARISAFNHLLVVTGEDMGVGRNGYVNLVASALTTAGVPVAIVELGSMSGSALRAHKTAGLKTFLVPSAGPNWYVELIDRIDDCEGHVVLLSIAADRWLDFGEIEAIVLSSVADARPVAFLFVDPAGRAIRLKRHIEWLAENGLPAFEHRLAMRGRELTDRRRPAYPGYQLCFSVPFLMDQVADEMFGRGQVGGDGKRRYATFDAAWQKATRGTRAAMFEPVKTALRDIGRLLELVTLVPGAR